MPKPSNFQGFTSLMKNQKTKKPLLKRFNRRRLLKDKSNMGVSKKKASEHSAGVQFGAMSDNEAGPQVEESVDSEAGDESDRTEHFTDPRAESDEPDATTSQQDGGHRSPFTFNNSSPRFKDAAGGSRTGHITDKLSFSKRVGKETEDSESVEAMENDQYCVEEIRSSRKDSGGKLEFLIKWQGQDKLDWEPEETLLESAPDIISRYLDENGDREATSHTPPQTKRKRGRPPKTNNPGTSDKPSEHKKQKLESRPMIEKPEKITVACDSGGRADAEIDLLPRQGANEESDAEETISVKEAGKRGPGRPPKKKFLEKKPSTLREDGVKRSRGRPRKTDIMVSSNENPSTVPENVVKRGRGRPRKFNVQVPSGNKSTIPEESDLKRGRGRPRKGKEVDTTQAGRVQDGNAPKRGRGRPPKTADSAPLPKAQDTAGENCAKRGRGRPRKVNQLENVVDDSQGDMAMEEAVG